MDDGNVLIGGVNSGMGGGKPGLLRLAVERGPDDGSVERGTDGWTVEERWTTTGLKPYLSDFRPARGPHGQLGKTGPPVSTHTVSR